MFDRAGFTDTRITVEEYGMLSGAVGLSEVKTCGRFDAKPLLQRSAPAAL